MISNHETREVRKLYDQFKNYLNRAKAEKDPHKKRMLGARATYYLMRYRAAGGIRD